MRVLALTTPRHIGNGRVRWLSEISETSGQHPNWITRPVQVPDQKVGEISGQPAALQGRLDGRSKTARVVGPEFPRSGHGLQDRYRGVARFGW
ncbi:hypothetical protein PJI17_21995 [Mycobacterium kansasii]